MTQNIMKVMLCRYKQCEYKHLMNILTRRFFIFELQHNNQSIWSEVAVYIYYVT